MPHSSSVSVYGSRIRGRVPVYGCVSHSSCNREEEEEVSDGECECAPAIDPLLALQNLLAFLGAFSSTLENYYVAQDIKAPLSADMSVRGLMSFRLFSRVHWSKLYFGNKFDIMNPAHINGLKDIYLGYNRDWRKDPVIVNASLLLGMGC